MALKLMANLQEAVPAVGCETADRFLKRVRADRAELPGIAAAIRPRADRQAEQHGSVADCCAHRTVGRYEDPGTVDLHRVDHRRGGPEAGGSGEGLRTFAVAAVPDGADYRDAGATVHADFARTTAAQAEPCLQSTIRKRC